MKRLLLVLACVAGLVAMGLTVYTFTSMERYHAQGGEFLQNASFEITSADGFEPVDGEDPDGWISRQVGGSVRFEDGAVIIENADPASKVDVNQILPVGTQRQFELSAIVETTAVVAGKKPWNVARVDFSGRLGEDRWDHNRPHVLFDGTGTVAQTEVRSFFELAPEVQEARVSLQLSNATGRMIVRELSLRPAAYDATFLAMDRNVRIAWFVSLALFSLWFFAGAAHKLAATAAVGLGLAGAAVVLLPSGFKDAIWDLLPGAAGDGDWSARAMHFVAFVVIAFLVALARRRERPRYTLPPLLLLAVGAEALQIVSGSLGFDDVIDLATNVFGVLIGVGVAEEHIKYRYGGRRRKKRRQEDREEVKLKHA